MRSFTRFLLFIPFLDVSEIRRGIQEQRWVSRNDDEFKFHLDRYKYPNHYDDVDEVEQRTNLLNEEFL